MISKNNVTKTIQILGNSVLIDFFLLISTKQNSIENNVKCIVKQI